MNRRRVLAIGLDGYEPSVGDAMMAAGELPRLARLRDRAAVVPLEHGAAKRTGLAWEHVASGLAPAGGDRWSAVTFDPDRYRAWQSPTTFTPFPEALSARTVVFDPPYFDLERAPGIEGLVAWGAHDPGVAHASRPAGIGAELRQRFGRYPAERWIYGFAWPSTAKTARMAAALEKAVSVRAQAARWLLSERLPAWDLGFVVVSELHSAAEALWHGYDPAHALRGVASATAAGHGLRAVYRAVDRLVGELTDAFPDATIVAFNLHGMGENRSDLASMLLLPELLFRHATGRTLLRPRADWESEAIPMLGESEDWGQAIQRLRPGGDPDRAGNPARRLGRRLRHVLGRRKDAAMQSLGWMPAAWYQPHWSSMAAFALPSFYDGQVRLNVAGRERRGIVPPESYATALHQIEELVLACRDHRTGEPVVAEVERRSTEPGEVGPTQADLAFVWKASNLGFDHPALGRIGPFPQRRTGGHTGGEGIAFIAGAGIPPGARERASAFDLVPTIVDLLGESRPARMSGVSFLERLHSPEALRQRAAP